jgi:hypothetical protein
MPVRSPPPRGLLLNLLVPLTIGVTTRNAEPFVSRLSVVLGIEGRTSEFVSLPAAAAAARRRFLSSKIASREGAGEADLVAGELTELGSVDARPALLSARFFRGAERGVVGRAAPSDAGYGVVAVSLSVSSAPSRSSLEVDAIASKV